MPECPCCESPVEDIHVGTWHSKYDGKTYKLYRCDKCDVQFWEPREVSPSLYEDELDSSYSVFHSGLRKGLGSNHKFFLQKFKDQPGRVLDIGCGDGLFLSYLKEMGFEVWGIDFDSNSVRIAKDKRNIERVFHATPEEFIEYATQEGLEFDYITAFEVIEHFERPYNILRSIRPILKKQGIIAGTVPNRDSIINIVYGRFLDDWDYPPHHLTWFSKKSLEKLFERSGFDVTTREIKSIALKDAGWVGYYATMGKFTTRSLSESNYPSSPIFKTFKSTLFAVLGIPLVMFSPGKYLYFEAKLKG